MKQIRAATTIAAAFILAAASTFVSPALAGMSSEDAARIVDFETKVHTPPSPTPHSYDTPSTPCTFNCPTYYYKPDGDRGIQYQTPLE